MENRGASPLLSVRDLSVRFAAPRGLVTAVDGISFDVAPGRVLGVVGESGSGKSVTAMTMMRLLPADVLAASSGEILFDGLDLARLRERELDARRGKDISIIFQDPMSSLNPILTVGRQICEPLRLHQNMPRAAAEERAAELLTLVGIPSPRDALSAYPHQLSGGQRQRVMIAIALACEPKLLIADEPTTALDVTTQAQILELLRDLQQRLGMAIIMITHDLGVVAEFAHDMIVMYAGRIVERGPVAEIFASPRHPYTQGLLASIPALEGDDLERLPAIPGTVPNLHAMPAGCAFEPRCRYAIDECRATRPALRPSGASRLSACLRLDQLALSA